MCCDPGRRLIGSLCAWKLYILQRGRTRYFAESAGLTSESLPNPCSQAFGTSRVFKEVHLHECRL